MSAFIVSNECMQTVVRHLVSRKHFAGFVFGDGFSREDRQKSIELGTALFAMNARSFHGRYPQKGGTAPEFTPGGYPAPKVATYKAIQCLLYQSDEVDVSADPLYQALNEVARDLAENIVRDLESFSAAAWG